MALYSGLSPGLVRSVFYGGLRLGLYEPSLRVSEMAFESPNILMKIVAGAFSGAVATAVTNPVEVLKVSSVMDLDLDLIGEKRKKKYRTICASVS